MSSIHPQESESIWPSIAGGALGGLVASLAMNHFQSALSAVSSSIEKKKRERTGEPKPKPGGQSGGDDATVKAAQHISGALFDHELTGSEKTWAGPLVHYGLGTTLGALYGALAPVSPVQSAAGLGYGFCVWLGADEVAVPLTGLSGPPSETPPVGHLKALASHLVFGLVTHAVRKLALS